MVLRAGTHPAARQPPECVEYGGSIMVVRRSQPIISEAWSGLWGTDARFYARRSDGVCFAFDGAASVFDLAGSSPPAPHARPVATLPNVGRYILSVFAARPTESSNEGRRVFAYGVRRRI
jgi:hypothetical protein